MRGSSHINNEQAGELQIVVDFIDLIKQRLIQTYLRSNYNQKKSTLGDTAVRPVAYPDQPNENHRPCRPYEQKVITRGAIRGSAELKIQRAQTKNHIIKKA